MWASSGWNGERPNIAEKGLEVTIEPLACFRGSLEMAGDSIKSALGFVIKSSFNRHQ
jgi:hypothetical protein